MIYLSIIIIVIICWSICILFLILNTKTTKRINNNNSNNINLNENDGLVLYLDATNLESYNVNNYETFYDIGTNSSNYLYSLNINSSNIASSNINSSNITSSNIASSNINSSNITSSSNQSNISIIWKDLSPSNNSIKLYNCSYSKEGGGSIIFNGNNSYGITINEEFNNFNYNNWTGIIWLKINSLESQFGGLLFQLNNSPDNYNFEFQWYVNKFIQYESTEQEYIDHSFLINEIKDLGWQQLVIVSTPENLIFYKNGIPIKNFSVQLNPNYGNKYFCIGNNLRELNNNNGLNAYISIIKIYNRALTSDMILNNYNTNKSKFDLN